MIGNLEVSRFTCASGAAFEKLKLDIKKKSFIKTILAILLYLNVRERHDFRVRYYALIQIKDKFRRRLKIPRVKLTGANIVGDIISGIENSKRFLFPLSLFSFLLRSPAVILLGRQNRKSIDQRSMYEDVIRKIPSTSASR